MSALLALSDVVVYRALERSFSRGLSGNAKSMAAEANIPRYEAYRRFPIITSRQTHALAGAWDVVPDLTWRWQLPVAAGEWATVLDHYTRSLLTSGAEHNLDDLSAALVLLGAGHAI